MEIHDSRPVDYRWHIMMMTMYLDRVRVTGLTQYLQQCGVRHEEESWKEQSFLLQVAG